MKKTVEKTNALRILDSHKISYQTYSYPSETALSANDICAKLNIDSSKVYKTLVTVGASKNHYVFMMNANSSLDLKKAAKVVGEKYIEMLKQSELLPLTGYVHGGCSPIGMKKVFATYIDESVLLVDKIICSGGKIGLQIELTLQDLQSVINIKTADLAEKED